MKNTPQNQTNSPSRNGDSAVNRQSRMSDAFTSESRNRESVGSRVDIGESARGGDLYWLRATNPWL